MLCCIHSSGLISTEKNADVLHSACSSCQMHCSKPEKPCELTSFSANHHCWRGMCCFRWKFQQVHTNFFCTGDLNNGPWQLLLGTSVCLSSSIRLRPLSEEALEPVATVLTCKKCKSLKLWEQTQTAPKREKYQIYTCVKMQGQWLLKTRDHDLCV